MSNVEPQSTPSSHRLTSRSQAGSVKFKKSDIKGDIAIDLRAAVKCPYDELVKYFLYLVLKEDSQEKINIDNLQAKIEHIQAGRYYKKDNDDKKGKKAENTEHSTIAGAVHEQARQEATEDDVDKNGTEEEKEMALQRENVLHNVFIRTLQLAFKIADDVEVKAALIVFSDSFKQGERERYGPFVKLCNVILERVKAILPDTLPLRNADKLDIRFLRNDPHTISSPFDGMTDDVVRIPDIIISSMAALVYLKGRVMAPDDYTKALTNLTWPFVLSTGEFKVHNREHPEGMIFDIRSHVYKFESISPSQEILHTQFENLDELEETTEGTDEQGPDNGINSEITDTGSKRNHDTALGTAEGQPPTKKSRTPTTSETRTAANSVGKSTASTPAQEVLREREDRNSLKGRVQCASYALEMLSYGAGVHHVVNLLFTDGILWIWSYDRQGIIQSTGISVFRDFPRFIVLLLAMQRFSLQDWGIIPALNPEAVREHNRTPSMTNNEQSGQRRKAKEPTNAVLMNQRKDKEDPSAPPVDIDFKEHLQDVKDLSSFLRERKGSQAFPLSRVRLSMTDHLSPKPHCLAGRATAVVPATGYGEGDDRKLDMVCKVYHPEVQRRHEGLTMRVIYDIAVNEESLTQHDMKMSDVAKMNMLNYLPQFYFHGDVKGTTTQRIRSMVNRKWKGHRTMRIIGMKKLLKVTTLSGWEFVKAWLEGVVCHAFLWKNFVEHGDPSISNLMYDPDEKCGVLTDFDLSLLQWEPRVFGTDRTGTVPFMALDLLTESYWKGLTKRYYHHELESFIWMLPYVFLQYKDGKRKANVLVDPWVTSDIDVCR